MGSDPLPLRPKQMREVGVAVVDMLIAGIGTRPRPTQIA